MGPPGTGTDPYPGSRSSTNDGREEWKEGLKTMEDDEHGFPTDEAPEGDAVEQLRPADSDDEAGLDTDYVSVGDREADEADVIEQAYVVPVEDDRDDDR